MDSRSPLLIKSSLGMTNREILYTLSMLYTRKGDDGTTKMFGCGGRMSKASAAAEALGALDEINSFLGLVKVKAREVGLGVEGEEKTGEEIIHFLQEGLFIAQAEAAGAEKTIKAERVARMEEITDRIEKLLPPITTFFISGGTEMAAMLDVARTMARRAERRVKAAAEAGEVKMGEETGKYLNRLSSILYALARLANYKAGAEERAPRYE